MTAAEFLVLIATGIAGGIMTSLVGGASLVTYPALLAIGLPPVTAVVVNLVALMPANLAAAWLDRGHLPRLTRPLLVLLGVSAVGGAIGALLLLATPEKLFLALVPLLLGLSTWLFAQAGAISRYIEARAGNAAAAERSRWNVTTFAMVPVAVYGGYFGAGAGVMLLALLMIVAQGEYRGANAIKNLISGINSLMAALVYVVQDAVAWGPVAVVTSAAIAGAILGMRIVRIVPRETMRQSVIGVGTVLTLVFAWRYWL